MVTGFTLFKYARAVKLHFTNEDYNIFTHSSNVRGTSFEHFLAGKDYNLYNALARKFEDEVDTVQFLVANYAYNNDPIHNFALSDRNYVIWNKRKQALSNTFKEDLSKIVLHLEKKKLESSILFNSSDSLPELFKIYLSGIISIETMYLINKINPHLQDWKKDHSLIWGKEFLLIERLDKFVKFNEETIRQIYYSNIS